MNNADTILVGYYLDQSAVGIYAAAFSLAVLLNLIVNGVGSLFLPNVAELVDSGQRGQFQSVYNTGTRRMLVLAVPIAFGLFSFPNLVLSLFGPEFPAGSEALVILSIEFFSHVTAGVNTPALQALNRTKAILLNQTVTVVSNIILNLLLIPHYGLVGAATATTVSFIFSNFLHNMILYTKEGISPVNKRTSAIAFAGLAVGVMTARAASVQSGGLAIVLSMVFATIWLGSCIGLNIIQRSELRGIVIQ